ncbi:hypothetical protein LCGC14_2571120 [marine sediment metagenome]|uniref:Uncharacterized protein n=1 Tax=marine sediment metagenome TaxID=412755 RepID=A0A0F9B550_9ZZZZ
MAEATAGKSGKAGVVLGGAALVTAAIALAQKRAQAAPGDGLLKLDEQTMALLIAMAQTTADIEQLVSQILGGLGGDDGPISLQVKGWPPNAEGVRTFVVVCAVVNRAYEASDMVIPDGMSLVIKASPNNAVGSLIYVAKSPAESINPNSSWPLVQNESISYQVKNANAFHVSTNVANSVAVFTAEQRS